MVTLYKNTLNKVVVTVNESAVNPCNDIYLFEFISCETQESFFCIANSVINLARYNAFCIKLVDTDPNPEAGELLLPLEGQYFYNIYENPDSLLDPTGLNNCESGKAQVFPQTAYVAPQYQSQIYPTYQIYGN